MKYFIQGFLKIKNPRKGKAVCPEKKRSLEKVRKLKKEG